MLNRAIKAAYDKVRQAERDRDAIIKQTYAVGDMIYYSHGENEVKVEVVGHSGDRIQVRSLNNSRAYWIGAYRVTC